MTSIFKPSVLQITWCVLAIYVSLFYFQKQLFITADLGRHLVNGRLILDQLRIPQTNLYSYTFPDYPVVLHHWLSGVVFYLIHQFSGFAGLTAFDASLKIICFLLCFRLALRHSSPSVAILTSLIALPLITHRREIRPEAFSYLFFCLYFYLLDPLLDHKPSISPHLLWIIPFIQFLWTNSHIYFIFGFAILTSYLLHSFYSRSVGLVHSRSGNNRATQSFNHLAIIIFLSLLTSLINPSFYRGLIEPFLLAPKFTFAVVEGETVFQVYKATGFYQYLYFIITSLLLLALLHYLYKTNRPKTKSPLPPAIAFLSQPQHHLFLFFLFLGFYQIRFIHLFGYVFLIFVPHFIQPFIFRFQRTTQHYLYYLAIAASFLIPASSFLINSYYSSWRDNLGLGLMQPALQVEDYLDHHPLTPPIFNNYNLGSYLIYRYCPEYKVFVDNRPEAYPATFFQNTYIPAFSDPQAWQELDNHYHFQTIALTPIDHASWVHRFIQQRLEDPQWQLTYQHPFLLIFTRTPPPQLPQI